MERSGAPGFPGGLWERSGCLAVEKSIYTCPMHPEIHRDEMGKCPEWGMNLKLEK